MKMKEKKLKPVAWQRVVVFILLLPIIVPLLLCIGIVYLVVTILLYLAAWLAWNTRGVHVVYVCSNSPNWQSHVENDILPILPQPRIVLNWSERNIWKKISLASMCLCHFGGYRDFNPMAMVFRPFHRVKIFRFHQAFLDAKHGKPEPLAGTEKEFLEFIKT